MQLDDKRKEMLKRHPLSVTVDLKCKGKLVLVALVTEGCESRSRSNLATAQCLECEGSCQVCREQRMEDVPLSPLPRL